MSSEIAIKVENLSKCYQVYAQPHDRLKESIYPRVQRLLGQQAQRYYQEFWALRDVSFEIKKGETVGIIGRNGSGKSTLLQMICGTLNPTHGSITTHGRIAALLELGSGFNPEFTGRENVYMNAAVLGLTRAETEARFADIVAFADIGDFIEQPVKTYSSGMMVRLAFAVIAHVDADILVVDEALAVGDAFFTQKCMRFLREFMRNGTVLFVSHDTAAVKNFCSFAVWLEKGKVVQEGAPKEVCERYLQAFYEAQQGDRATAAAPRSQERRASVRKDQRQQFINHSNLRNDLQVFQFDPASASFGKGGAQITNVEFLDADGAPLAWVVGGEEVTLRVVASALEQLDAPIIGFVVKDRLGQALFGDNTYLSYATDPQTCCSGEEIQADFRFAMPILPVGDYSINVAIASGTQEQHVQHHWMHDAVLFKSESTSASTGLVGIPMLDIALTAYQPHTKLSNN
ncbi:ABC transporter ATP-binding protein [Pseudoduganella sp. S-14]|jgi:lipopolysaccharide transport system ATP-binding protein|uniref:ABC transporter ATP-binding protein n=1 Tax=Pseudoduganella sp. S-14 TaxID=3404065 RepID=UPI003CEC5334